MNVVVLGMHRSGTSAAARVVNLLGVRLSGGELVPVTDANPQGHWESLALRERNDELLAALGGNWAGPPPLVPGWEADPALAHLAGPARATFAAEYPSSPWVWKDPRLCITLPWWERVLGIRPVVILIGRDPLEVADSLARRDELSVTVGLALWERHTRDALVHCQERPVWVTSYEALVDDPAAWTEAAAAFLESHGVPVARERQVGEASASVDGGLRHGLAGHDSCQRLSPSQVALRDCFLDLEGAHSRFEVPQLPPPSPWMDVLLEEHARFYQERQQLRADLTQARLDASRIVNMRRLKISAYKAYRRVAPSG